MECPICLGEFRDPRVLPCLHSFCMVCLQTYASTQTGPGTFKCPNCRKECRIPQQGIEWLPKNFLLNTLRDINKAAQKCSAEEQTIDKEDQRCDDVTDKCVNWHSEEERNSKAVVFCLECGERYCEDCAKGPCSLQSHALSQVVAHRRSVSTPGAGGHRSCRHPQL